MDGVPVGVKDSLGFIGVMAGLIEVLENRARGLSTISSFGIEVLKQQITGHCVSAHNLLQV